MQNGNRLANESEAGRSTCLWGGVRVVPGHVAQDVGLDDHGRFQHLHLPLLLQAVLQRLPQEDLRAEEQEEQEEIVTVSPSQIFIFLLNTRKKKSVKTASL